MHARVLAADIAGQFQDQTHGQRRGGVAAPLRPAQHDPTLFGGLHLDRGVAHARSDQKLQIGQCLEHGALERCALAHRADDFEILQRVRRGLHRSKRLVEYLNLDPIVNFGPIRRPQRQVHVVVENCTAQPRHGGSDHGDDDGAEMHRRRAPWLLAMLARASARGPKSARASKGARALRARLAPELDHQAECGWESVSCFARQAGPGPRM